MRRFLAILLMFLMPLQVTWAAAAALHGHFDDDGTVSLFHYHDDHDHHGDAHHDDGSDATGLTGAEHHDVEHHEGHFHPVFTMFIVEPNVNLGLPLPDAHPPWPAQSFSSHIPPVFDRPPLALR